MNKKILQHLNKLRKTHTIQQIADICWYKYHTIFYILKNQEISDRQTERCYSGLYDNAKGELDDIEMMWHTPLDTNKQKWA